MEQIKTYIILFVCHWLTMTSIYAEESLKIVGKESYPPYSFINENNKLTGIDVEIINEALKISGIKAKIHLYPWPRVLNLVKEGWADGIFGAAKNQERLSYLDYPEIPLRHTTFSFFVNEHFRSEINGIQDIGNEEVGLIRDYFVSDELENSPNIKKYFASTSKQLLTQVSMNRRKIAIYSSIAGRYELIKYGINNIKIIPYSDAPSYSSYLAFSKKSKRAQDAFTKISDALKHLKETGFMKEVYNKYR